MSDTVLDRLERLVTAPREIVIATSSPEFRALLRLARVAKLSHSPVDPYCDICAALAPLREPAG